jgi:transcription elongation factor GreB
VRFLGKRLEEVVVVREPPGERDRVFFGAWVRLEDEDGREVEWRIVGADESDVKTGAISVDSPVARALMGKREGDEVTVRAPRGEVIYAITGIRYA